MLNNKMKMKKNNPIHANFLTKLIAVLICVDYLLKYLNSCAGLFKVGLR